MKMHYFTYGRKLVDDVFNHPTGLFPTPNSTCSVFYNANYFGAAELESLDDIWWFDPTEISEQEFMIAYNSISGSHTGSL